MKLEEDPRTLCRVYPLSFSISYLSKPDQNDSFMFLDTSDTIYVDVSKLAEERVSAIKDKIKTLVSEANYARPSCLILDGLDSVCGVELEVKSPFCFVLGSAFPCQASAKTACSDFYLAVQHVDTTRPRQIAEFLVTVLTPLSAGEETFKEGVVVIATAKSPLDVHPLLSVKHVFAERVGINPLAKEGRKEASQSICY